MPFVLEVIFWWFTLSAGILAVAMTAGTFFTRRREQREAELRVEYILEITFPTGLVMNRFGTQVYWWDG